MPTWITAVRRHGIARTGRLGVGMRGRALALSAMGDPRFSLRRALTIPRKVRQAIVGTAVGALGGIPIVGPALKGAITSHPKYFPNLPPSMITGPAAMAGLDLPAMPSFAGYPSTPAYSAKDYARAARSAGVHVGGRRRMNWANSRALGRAERRLVSFVKHFTRHARHLGYHVGRGPRGRAHLPRRKR